MEIKTLNERNIAEEHICCAISDKKCLNGYNQKKNWLKKQFSKGYVFKKIDVKHKVFIEYCPAEIAWASIEANEYMFINCFWVAGSYKGKGFGKQLLSECIKDSKNKNGVLIISSDKKRPFLADKKFFLKNGFDVCDYAPPYFELLVKKNKSNAKSPKFKKVAKENICEDKKSLTVYYSDQCPFTDYYVNIELKEIAKNYGIPLKIIHIDTKEKAHAIPSAFGIHNVFYKGKFLTHELLTKKRFDNMWKEIKNI
ncbi:MAG: GNAT family N-acetyltransferase [Candidatus Omnitrophota bacterium]